MTRTRVTFLIVLARLAYAGLYLTEMPRYRAEERARKEIARLTHSPVKYVRVEGVAGLQYVNTVWLEPHDTLVLESVDLGPQLSALSRLQTICIDPKYAPEEQLEALRARYPEFEFSTNVGFSWKPRFRFVYSEPPA